MKMIGHDTNGNRPKRIPFLRNRISGTQQVNMRNQQARLRMGKFDGENVPPAIKFLR